MATEKTCFRCLMVKQLDGFYPHAAMKDGHLNKCIECTKKDVAQHRLTNLERVRAYDRARASAPHRVSLRQLVQARYRIEHPERRAAHVALGNAVRAGRVVPWPICAIPECDCKPQAHHPDYSRPLDVVWLCDAHHKQAHAITKA